MVKRKADELIRNFILNDRRSLLVTGARQVGKTFSIRKVGKECFDNVVEINFVEQPDAIELNGFVVVLRKGFGIVATALNKQDYCLIMQRYEILQRYAFPLKPARI